MRKTEQTFNIDITPHVSEAGHAALKMSFGGKEGGVLYLHSPQARALASYLTRRTPQLHAKSGRSPV